MRSGSFHGNSQLIKGVNTPDHGLAELLYRGRRLEQEALLEPALELYEGELALCFHPQDQAKLLRAIGRVRFRQCDVVGAEAALARAVELTPDHPLSLTSWGCTLQSLARHPEALAAHQRAVAVDPDCDQARMNLGLHLLLLGSYGDAWPHYERRMNSLITIAVPDSIKRWNGTSTPSELIIVAEQGIGDLLQFCRYAPLLQMVTPIVSLVVDRKLHPLLQRAGLFQRLYDVAMPFDPEPGAQWLPLMTLPELMSLTCEHVMLDAPYLQSDPEQLHQWASRLQTIEGLRVGLGWQGDPKSEMDGQVGRSMPLEQLAPLTELNRVEFVSLQKGPGSEQLDSCSFLHRFCKAQPEVDRTWDFLETLAIIEQCDLVITTDTALAHLAGAMGQPTWILLKAVPDWRWGLRVKLRRGIPPCGCSVSPPSAIGRASSWTFVTH